MILVAREKKDNEKGLFAIEYYDCDLNETKVENSILFESYDLAKRYGEEHYNFDRTGFTSFCRIVMANDGKEAVRPLETLDKWDVDHPLCRDHCPCSMHPEFCPDFATCPRFPY